MSSSTRQFFAAKVSKVLSSSSRVRVDSGDMLASLESLSSPSFYVTPSGQPAGRFRNTLQARRHLRSVLERRAVRTNQRVVDAFSGVHAQVQRVRELVESLSSNCEHITARLRSARQSTSQLLAQTTALQEQQQVVARRREAIAALLARFQLTPEQEGALDGEEIDAAFFDALARSVQIRGECQRVLQEQHVRAVLDVADSVGKRIEKSYEKLYLWVQRKGRELVTPDRRVARTDEADIEPNFVRALAMLQERPSYFQLCVQEIYQARRILKLRQFISSLTHGSHATSPSSTPSSAPRPIDIHAHDPVRYVSDIMAWVHEAAVSEREFFEAIFADVIRDDQPAAAEAGSTDAADEVARWRSLLLGEVFRGVQRHLKGRVEHALLSQPSVLVCYRVANVLDFYCFTLAKFLPEDVPLHTVLRDLKTYAEDMFFTELRAAGTALVDSPPRFNRDLTTPRAIVEQLNQLEQIMAVFNSSLTASLVAASDAENALASQFSPVLAAVVDPILDAVHASAEELDTSDAAVYTINVLSAVDAVLSLHKHFTEMRRETLSLELSARAKELANDQVRHILLKCGLAEQAETLRQARSEQQPLADKPGMALEQLAEGLQRFSKSLFSVGMFVMPQVDRILQPNLRNQVRQRVHRMVSSVYHGLYAALHDAAEYNVDELQRYPLHTPDQIDTVLNLQSGDAATI